MGIFISVLILFIGHLGFTLHLINGLKSDINSLKSDLEKYFEARLKAELAPINNKLDNHITVPIRKLTLLMTG